MKRSALKFAESLNGAYKRKLLELIEVLKKNPVPVKLFDVKKLRGLRNCFRVRIGKLRVVYEVDWTRRRVIIHFVGWREKAY